MTVAGVARAQRRPGLPDPAPRTAPTTSRWPYPVSPAGTGVTCSRTCHRWDRPDRSRHTRCSRRTSTGPTRHPCRPNTARSVENTAGTRRPYRPIPLRAPSRSKPQATVELSRMPAGRRVGPNTVEWTSTSAGWGRCSDSVAGCITERRPRPAGGVGLLMKTSPTYSGFTMRYRSKPGRRSQTANSKLASHGPKSDVSIPCRALLE
jgi:hypothetical protein